MEKKGLYVVTETNVRLSKKEITQFIVGTSRDFGIARSILKDLSGRMIADGFDEKLFDYPNKWEWTYSSFDFIIQGEILFTDDF